MRKLLRIRVAAKVRAEQMYYLDFEVTRGWWLWKTASYETYCTLAADAMLASTPYVLEWFDLNTGLHVDRASALDRRLDREIETYLAQKRLESWRKTLDLPTETIWQSSEAIDAEIDDQPEPGSKIVRIGPHR